MAGAEKQKTAAELREEAETLKKAREIVERDLRTPDSAARGDTTLLKGTQAVALAATAREPAEEGMLGFRNLGEFAHEVRQSRLQGTPSTVLKSAYGQFEKTDTFKKAATGMGELVGSDGGFLVPPTFASKIFERVYKQNDLLARTDNYPVAGNSMVFPRNNESSRANGSRWGGVRAYWVQEGGTITKSAPTFGRNQVTLAKLACLAAVTDELLADYPAMSAYLNRVFPDEINFVVGDSLVNGTGAGQPLGILNAACTVSVSKETGQDAATLVSANLVKMWARLFRGMGSGENSGAVWFVNQDVNPQLQLLTLGIGTAGVVTYMPPGGLSGKPYATLMGAPVVEIEWCATLGTVGDIILADMSQMISISKAMEAAQSMHLYFDTDQTAFRVTFRLGAQPWWAAALTPFKGSATQSCFVTLATRS